MSTRQLGKSDLFITPVGFGAWAIGGGGWEFAWGGQDDQDSIAAIREALDAGVNWIDTAAVYGLGHSEEVVARALDGVRDRPYVFTKCSMVWDERRRIGHSLKADSIRRECEASLRRLRVDAIDLYQVHWPNPLVAQRSTMAGMHTLQAGGLVGQVGVSNYGLGRWRAAEAALGTPVVSNQVRYSLLTRRPERRLLPHAAAAGRLVVAYSPLAQGVLAAKYTADTAPGGVRAGNLLFSAENLRRAGPVLDALRELAGTHRVTPAQVALAWVVSHPNVVAIPGATSVAQVEANAAAADLRLAPDELAHLTGAADRFSRELVGSASAVLGRRLRPVRRPAER